MLDGLGTVNKKTGEATINAWDMQRIKAFASATNTSYGDAVQSIKTKAKRNAIEQTLNVTPILKNTDEDTKNILASISQFKEGRGFEVNVQGKQKLLTELSKSDLEYLKPQTDNESLRSVAQNTLGISDIIKNGFEALLTKLTSELIPKINDIAGFLLKISDFVLNPKGNNIASSVASGLGGGIGASIFSGAGGLLGGGMKVAGKALGYAGAGAGIGGIISAGSDWMSGGSFGHGLGMGAGSMVGSAAGGLVGSLAGPLGTAIGMALVSYLGEKGASLFMDNARDVLIPSGGGRPIKLDTKDDVYAMKPGGAIQQSIMPRNETSSIFSGVSPSYNNSSSNGSNNSSNNNHKVDLSGSITLNMAGGGSSRVDASELMRNPQFVREMSRIISQINNRDDNGGGYSGPLGPDSF